jgi:hypothetical protein
VMLDLECRKLVPVAFLSRWAPVRSLRSGHPRATGTS